MERFVAEVPDNLEVIVARVKREAAEECARDHAVFPILDQCAQDAVVALWDSRIKTFVPLLALRRVRCCIRDGSCETDAF